MGRGRCFGIGDACWVGGARGTGCLFIRMTFR